MTREQGFFEFMFIPVARCGLCATPTAGGQEDLCIPEVDEVWAQPKYGSIPHFMGDDYSKCLLVKLAQKHVAIDYLILDCTPLGKKT